jgi:hypothetical protein
MMAKRRAAASGRTFRDLLDMFGEDRDAVGDISLAGFLLDHGFLSRDTSVGLIGASSRLEVMALNALVSPGASLVALGLTKLMDQHTYLTDLVGQLEGGGFELRLQLADLTLPGRWPTILAAMARTDIGILGIDAHWAATEQDFWTILQKYMQTGHSLVYLRNMLGFRHPEFCLPFIRSMPSDCALDVVAATPTSVWFASDAATGATTRELLHSSGLFTRPYPATLSLSADSPCIVEHESVLSLIDSQGCFPFKFRSAQSPMVDGLIYATGWSNVEADGCWTVAEEAIIKLDIVKCAAALTSISITGNSWIPPTVTTQIVAIGIGREPREWTEMAFNDPEEISTTIIDLADIIYDDSPTLTINVRVRSPGRPSDYGGSDTRLLGFKFRSLAVFR